jgi:hypothetical protein
LQETGIFRLRLAIEAICDTDQTFPVANGDLTAARSDQAASFQDLKSDRYASTPYAKRSRGNRA